MSKSNVTVFPALDSIGNMVELKWSRVLPMRRDEAMKLSRYALAAMFLFGSLFAFGLSARADRIQSMRCSGQRNNGARSDITVPYLTTGNTAFMPNKVSPKIYSSPIVDDPGRPQSRPVYNLIFYGSKQGFGDASNGAREQAK